ncbi:MAG: hypothetical protein IJS53_05795 [Clostridia bacterium]|nr:hypothetical protein [Clostridia bacterium]
MRKLLAVFLIVFLLTPAMAEETDPARAWFDAQYAALVPYGAEAEREEETFGFVLSDGGIARSLRLTVEGNIRFGRYAQVTRTALMGEAGAELGLDAIFTDLDALQEFLDAYVEENVLDQLNTYLDAADLLPVPLDCVSFDEYGATFHYPSERFMFFSGHAGAVQLMWYELEDYLALPSPAADQLAEARQGGFLGIRLSDTIDALLERFGQVTEPDFVFDDCLIYDFESPALRGVQAYTHPAEEGVFLRTTRFDLNGVRPGMTAAEAEALLGAADYALDFSDDEFFSEAGRLRKGTMLEYAFDSVDPDDTDAGYYAVGLYFDETGALYLADLTIGL